MFALTALYSFDSFKGKEPWPKVMQDNTVFGQRLVVSNISDQFVLAHFFLKVVDQKDSAHSTYLVHYTSASNKEERLYYLGGTLSLQGFTEPIESKLALKVFPRIELSKPFSLSDVQPVLHFTGLLASRVKYSKGFLI